EARRPQLRLRSRGEATGHAGRVMDLLVLDSVTKRFASGPEPAIERLTLAAARGEILGLVGPSGCGKTTTLRLIAGFEAPDEGEVLIGGRTVAKAGSREFVPPEARGVGGGVQGRPLFPPLPLQGHV